MFNLPVFVLARILPWIPYGLAQLPDRRVDDIGILGGPTIYGMGAGRMFPRKAHN